MVSTAGTTKNAPRTMKGMSRLLCLQAVWAPDDDEGEAMMVEDDEQPEAMMVEEDEQPETDRKVLWTKE